MRILGLGVAMLLSFGCSGGGNTDESTPTPEPSGTSTPNPTPTPTVGTLTVQVRSGLAGYAGEDIVVQEPDGTVVAIAQTDSAGNVSVSISGPVIVSLVRGIPPDHSLSTKGFVQPGETVTFDGGTSRKTVIDVSLPGAFSGAESYVMGAQCGPYAIADPLAASPLRVEDHCTVGLSTHPVAAVARISTSTAPQAFTFAEAALSGTTGVAVLPAWRTDFDDVTVHASNAPAGASGLSINIVPHVGRHSLRAVSSGLDYSVTPGGEATTVVPVVPEPAGSRSHSISVKFGFGEPARSSVQARGPASATFDVDLGDLLPELTMTSTQVGSTVTFDWNDLAAFAATDVANLVVVWETSFWSLELPPDLPGTFVLPVLPAPFEAYNPPAYPPIFAALWFVDYSHLDGYAQYRVINPHYRILPDTGTTYTSYDEFPQN